MAIVLDGTSGITSPNETITGSLNTPNTFGFKNRIINGGMVIDQRNAGASVTVTNSSPYTVDRIIAGMSGANGTAQRVSSSVSGFQYQVTLTGTTSTTTTWFGTRIESYNCIDLVGQSITVSFYAASSNQTQLAVGIYYANTVDGFGNGATVTSISSSNVNITSTMTKYSVTFTALPSQVSNGFYLQFVSGGSLGTGTISFTGVQLEKDSVATSFDQRAYSQELSLCQRYYASTYATTSFVVSGGVYASHYFPVQMRAAPTIVTSGGTTGTAISSPSVVGFYVNGTATASGNWTASAEL